MLAGGKDFKPENILFEQHTGELAVYPSFALNFEKEGHYFEIFREYSDCLYAAYATKWNGNAAAYNGSLFVVQDGRIRRLSPLECERMMGFPDNYTNIHGARRTNRYQAVGNSWAVPVVRWIGERLIQNNSVFDIAKYQDVFSDRIMELTDKNEFYDFGKEKIELKDSLILNCTAIPEHSNFVSLQNIISADAPEAIYLSPVGCQGILRRKKERNISINLRLEEILSEIAAKMPAEEIEKSL